MFIRDSEFIRGTSPMTKEEVRILTISKMNIQPGSAVLDIGTGTGSITVQAARIANKGRVYSIEKNPEALEVAMKNIEKFNCRNVLLDNGDAVEILKLYSERKLRFDSIFIGGSGGNIEEIIRLSEKLLNASGIMIMNFITLDNLYKASEVLKELNFNRNITLVNISKNNGSSYMMKANNPIYILESIKEGSN